MNTDLRAHYFKPSYYWRHPLEFLKEGWRAHKYKKQRQKRGFCERDWWNTSEYLLALMADMLDELAEHGHGYSFQFKDEDEWKKWLRAQASNLRLCSMDYLQALTYRKMPKPNFYVDEKGIEQIEWEDDAAADAYCAYIDKVYSEAEQRLAATFKELALHWYSLWD